MQILPDTFVDRAEDALGAARSSLPGDEAFARALSESIQKDRHAHTDASPSPDAPGRDADEAVERALLAGSPYNPTPELLSPFAPQAVRLNAKETDALAEAMRDDGVSAKALAALREAGRMPGGAGVDQLILAARRALEGASPDLSREEQALLASVAQKAAGSAGKEVGNLFSDGTPQSALAALMAGLADSPATTTITTEEMAALAKALRLPEGVTRTLLDAFRGEPSLTLSGREWNALLAPAKAQTDMAAADMDKLLTSLEKRMTPILRDASKREEMERLAGMREDKAVAQARTLITDRATQAAPGREDEVDPDKQTRAAPRRDHAERAEATAAGQAAARADNRPGDEADAPARSGREPAQAARTAPPDRAAGREAADAEASGARDENRPDRDGGRSRERTGETRATASAPSPSPALYATVSRGVDTVIPQAPQAAPTPGDAGRAALSARTLEQIEQAVLTAGKNGTRRLEVALTPENLGGMTVVLTTRHGEVSALIQPERAETAALIAQQTEHIKAQLENQGFKVEKVDVQPQLSDQPGQDWQGADQHNASRDLAARVEEMDRLRRMGRSGSASADAASSPLARDMHLQARPASVAGRGLHIIA